MKGPVQREGWCFGGTRRESDYGGPWQRRFRVFMAQRKNDSLTLRLKKHKTGILTEPGWGQLWQGEKSSKILHILIGKHSN